MALKYQDALKKGLHFGFSPERWLPAFVADAAFFALAYILLPPSLIPQVIVGIVPRVALGELFVLFIAWLLIRLWITGALIHQAHKDHEMAKSWHFSWKRYPSLFGVTLVIGLLTMIAGLAPLLSPILALLISIVCYFALQSVMIKHRPVMKALSESHWLFHKNFRRVQWDDPFFLFWVAGSAGLLIGLLYVAHFLPGVLLTWITLSGVLFLLLYSRIARAWAALSLVSGAITVVFAFPLLLYPIVQNAPVGQFLPALVYAYSSSPHTLLPLIMVFLLGSSIAMAFTLKAQTEFYHQVMKKRFWLL